MAAQAGVDRSLAHGGLTPKGKLDAIEALKKELGGAGVAMVRACIVLALCLHEPAWLCAWLVVRVPACGMPYLHQLVITPMCNCTATMVTQYCAMTARQGTVVIARTGWIACCCERAVCALMNLHTLAPASAHLQRPAIATTASLEPSVCHPFVPQHCVHAFRLVMV